MAVHIFGNDVLEEIKTYRQRRGKRLRDSSNRDDDDDDTRRHAHLVGFAIDAINDGAIHIFISSKLFCIFFLELFFHFRLHQIFNRRTRYLFHGR